MAVPTLEFGAESGVLAIPALGFGFGTAWYQVKDEAVVRFKESITNALEAGFRHLDAAEMYGNDHVAGPVVCEWLTSTKRRREELFVTNKVISVDAGVVEVCRKQLEVSGLQYFDLYLVHAPFQKSGEAFAKPLATIWSEMEQLVRDGLVRHIGVSNWRVQDLEQVWDRAEIKPACNQIEGHPYLLQEKLIAYCLRRKILLTYYGPQLPLTKLKGGPVDELLETLAEKYQATAGQVLLRWVYQQGVVPITTTSKIERMKEYMASLDLQLTKADMEAISAAGHSQPKRVFWTQCPQFHADPREDADW